MEGGFMVVTNRSVIEAIDVKITEIETEVERLRTAAQLLPKIESDLMALRRTRALLNGEEIEIQTKTPVITKNGSIAEIVGAILAKADQPLHVNKIFERFKANGGTASKATITSTLARLNGSKFRRT